jgi:hypothetical protein
MADININDNLFSFTSTSQLIVNNGGTIESTANGDLSFIPNGTGIVYIGTGSPGHLTPTSGELYVQGKCEIDGTLYADGSILLGTSGFVYGGTDCTFGNSDPTNYGALRFRNTASTPDTCMLLTGAISNAYVMCEYSDRSYDHAHALQTNPTLFIQSANQSATEWISFTHDQTDGLISAGTGLKLTTGANGDLVLDPNGTGIIDIQDDLKTDRWLDQDSNTFIGIGVAGSGNLTHTSGIDGWYNTAVGADCMNSITTGYQNVGAGHWALEALTSGSFNIGLGDSSLYHLSTGDQNVAIGFQSLYDVAITSYNVGVGYRSLFEAWGTGNTCIGHQSGDTIGNGDYNCCFGFDAGDNITSGSNNIIIGSSIDAQSATNSYQINIGEVFKCANYNSNGDVLIEANGTGDFSVDTNSTERFLITGNTGIHHFPTTSGFAAYRNTSYECTNSSYTTIPFDTEEYDISSEYATTGIFTAAEAGYYTASWGVLSGSYAWDAGEVFYAGLSKNDSTAVGSWWAGSGTRAQTGYTGYASSVGSKTVKLAAGNTLRIKVYQDRGASTYLQASGVYNYFSVQKCA